MKRVTCLLLFLTMVFSSVGCVQGKEKTTTMDTIVININDSEKEIYVSMEPMKADKLLRWLYWSYIGNPLGEKVDFTQEKFKLQKNSFTDMKLLDRSDNTQAFYFALQNDFVDQKFLKKTKVSLENNSKSYVTPKELQSIMSKVVKKNNLGTDVQFDKELLSKKYLSEKDVVQILDQYKVKKGKSQYYYIEKFTQLERVLESNNYNKDALFYAKDNDPYTISKAMDLNSADKQYKSGSVNEYNYISNLYCTLENSYIDNLIYKRIDKDSSSINTSIVTQQVYQEVANRLMEKDYTMANILIEEHFNLCGVILNSDEYNVVIHEQVMPLRTIILENAEYISIDHAIQDPIKAAYAPRYVIETSVIQQNMTYGDYTFLRSHCYMYHNDIKYFTFSITDKYNNKPVPQDVLSKINNSKGQLTDTQGITWYPIDSFMKENGFSKVEPNEQKHPNVYYQLGIDQIHMTPDQIRNILGGIITKDANNIFEFKLSSDTLTFDLTRDYFKLNGKKIELHNKFYKEDGFTFIPIEALKYIKDLENIRPMNTFQIFYYDYYQEDATGDVPYNTLPSHNYSEESNTIDLTVWGRVIQHPITLKNSGFAYLSVPNYSYQNGKEGCAYVLDRWWDISKRDDAIDTLNSLCNFEPTEYYKPLYKDIDTYTLTETSLKQIEDRRVRFYYEILLEQRDIIENVGVPGWELGRVFAVAENSYASGYITEEEMATYMQTAKTELEKYFDDPAMIVNNYLIGYIAWQDFNIENCEERIDLIEAAYRNPFSPINKLKDSDAE